MSNKNVPDLVVTRGDGVALPDQKAALAEFKEQALSKSAGDVFRGSDEKLIQVLQDRVYELERAMRQVRNSLGAYRYYENSSCLEDADNIAKLALEDSGDAAGGE